VPRRPVIEGGGQTPGEAAVSKASGEELVKQQKEAQTTFISAQKEGALIAAARRKTAELASDPTMVGPGRQLAQGLAELKTILTGKPPDSLVTLKSLDKVLLQMGAQNVRAALEGQKITQSEFLLMLGKGNPNTEQPLPTINNLLEYASAQNEYDQRFARTKGIALQRGANPMTVDTDIGSQMPREDFVEKRVGVRPPPTGSSSGSAPADGGAKEGAVSKSRSGKDIIFKDGHWQYK
jgi:hypothetical protein